MDDVKVKKLERKVQLLEKKIEKIKKWIWLKFEDEIPDELLQDEVDNDIDRSLQIVQNKSSRPRVTRASLGDTDDDELEIISEIPPSSYDNNLIQIDDDDVGQDDGDIQIIENEEDQEQHHQTQMDPVIVSTETICDPLALEVHNSHSTYQNQQHQQDQNNLYISGEARIIDTATIIGNNHQDFANHDPNVNCVNNDEEMYNVDPLSIDLPINRSSRVLPPSNPLPDIDLTSKIFTTTQNLIDSVIEHSLSLPLVEHPPEPAEPEDLNLVIVKNEEWVQQNYQLEDTYYQEAEGEGDYENNELDQDQNDYEYYENQNENENEYYQDDQGDEIGDSETNPQEYSGINNEKTNAAGKSNYDKSGTWKKPFVRRTRFTQRQLDALRKSFKSQMYPSHEECLRLSHELNLTVKIIRYWFNRQRLSKNLTTSTTKDVVKNFIKNRLSYSDDQLKILRDYLNRGKPILTPTEAEDISQKTGLPKFSIYRWFKNKRRALMPKSRSKSSATATNPNPNSTSMTNVNETDTITLNYQSEDSDSESYSEINQDESQIEAHSSTTENPHKKSRRKHVFKTESQLAILRKYFYDDGITHLEIKSKILETISKETSLSESVVFNWFVNNRRKEENLRISNSMNKNMTINSDSGAIKSTQQSHNVDNDNDADYYDNDNNGDSDCEKLSLSSQIEAHSYSTENLRKKGKVVKTESQLVILRKYFYDDGIKNLKLNSEKLECISRETNLPPRIVHKWFINTRAKEDENSYYNDDNSSAVGGGGDSDDSNDNSTSTSRKRTKFTDLQMQILNKHFKENNLIDSRAGDISQETGLDQKIIRRWFNNKNYEIHKNKGSKNKDKTIKSVYSVSNSNNDICENSNSSSTSTSTSQTQRYNYNYNRINNGMPNLCDDSSAHDSSREKPQTFTESQLTILRKYFYGEGVKYVSISSDLMKTICSETGLEGLAVHNWFNNYRLRLDRERTGTGLDSVSDGLSGNSTRRPRTKFTKEQLDTLWSYYNKDKDLDTGQPEKISLETGLSPLIITNWFKNRNYLIAKGAEVHPPGQESSKSQSVPNSTAESSINENESESTSTWYTSSSNFDDFNDSQAKRRKTVFSDDQVKILWEYFDEEQKNFDISDERVEKASLEIDLPQRVVLNWFKNKNYQILKGTVVYPGTRSREQGTSSASRPVSRPDSKKTNSIFTARQIAILVTKFKRNPRPDTYEYEDIAEELGSNFKAQSIRNWFQNQRTVKKKGRGSISTSSSSIGRRQSQNEIETETEVEIIENTTSTSTNTNPVPEPDTSKDQDNDLSESQDIIKEDGNKVDQREKVENLTS